MEQELKRWAWLLVTAMVLGLVGCGSSEVRDRPSDCRDDQFFDERRELCRSCPAVEEPTCLSGCDVVVGSDRRGCPVLRCEALCQGCDEGQVWDGQAEACVDAES